VPELLDEIKGWNGGETVVGEIKIRPCGREWHRTPEFIVAEIEDKYECVGRE